MAKLQLGNSLNGLILVYLTFSLPLSTWLLQGYFRGVPRELEEQAMVDGSTTHGRAVPDPDSALRPGSGGRGDLHLHRRLERAAARPDLHHVGDKRTVPLGINYLITSDVLPWGPLMAGAVLSSLPVMLLYFVAQRFMVQGMTSGSVKG